MNTVNIKINGYSYTMKHGITILDASFETMKFQREYLQQPIPTRSEERRVGKECRL